MKEMEVFKINGDDDEASFSWWMLFFPIQLRIREDPLKAPSVIVELHFHTIKIHEAKTCNKFQIFLSLYIKILT